MSLIFSMLIYILPSPFYKHKYGFHSSRADLINSTIYLLTMSVSPLAGAFIGEVGCTIFFLMAAISMTWIAHSVLAFTLINPWSVIVLFGLANAMVASMLWPMVSKVVPSNYLGTAYGVSRLFMNLGIGSTAMVAGHIIDNKGYLFLEIFFIVLISSKLDNYFNEILYE